ncbi:MAG: alpha/beta fold family hydrolase [Actinomycetia bacterium]|nr:alpha/beta fold family hydrolase [Actinomycetes bacterium]
MRANVTFDSAGRRIAGHLYTPDDGAAGPRPAIVVGGPGSSVKEQAAGLYARHTATATDHRIKAVATVSAVDIARQFRYGADGAQDPGVFHGMLDAAGAARTAEARGEGVQTFPLFPATAEEARGRGQHTFEGFEYYCTPRAQHPPSAKSLTWTSVDRMAFFDAFRAVGLIRRPLLMNVGREAVTAWMSVEAFQAAQCPKELHWIDGASHNDLYDKEQYVGPTVAKLTEFFTASLTERSRRDAAERQGRRR